jgi:hypothetical protein
MPAGVPCQIAKLHYVNLKLTKRGKRYSRYMSRNHDMISPEKSSKIHVRITKIVTVY